MKYILAVLTNTNFAGKFFREKKWPYYEHVWRCSLCHSPFHIEEHGRISVSVDPYAGDLKFLLYKLPNSKDKILTSNTARKVKIHNHYYVSQMGKKKFKKTKLRGLRKSKVSKAIP
jgi:hypothetical protein